MKQHLHFIFILFITATATAQVTKLSNNTNLQYGLPVNGKFLMVAKDGSLWSTDGTAANTKKFTTKVTFNNDTGSAAIINNKLYFAGVNTAGGTELWVTDGTDAGTSLVKDIRSGAVSSYPQDFNVINNIIYFSANDGTHGTELWRSDGTGGGTSLVKDINPGAAGGLDSATYFVNNNTLFFTPNDGTHGTELWKSDGTSGGTTLVKDIVAGSGEPSYSTFTALGTKIIFEVTLGSFLAGTEQLWATDGTTTTLLKDFGNFSGFPTIGYIKLNSKIYFSATSFTTNGTELWVTDGTAAGTSLVKDINPGINSSSPLLYSQVIFGNKFAFSASTTANGNELWTSDGTAGGTVMIKDINPGAPSSNPFLLSNYSAFGLTGGSLYNGKIFVVADDGTHGTELWISDGTGANTSLVKDIQAGSGSGMSGSTTYFYTTAGLYFGADDGVHGMELWKSDGTPGGTTIVKDVNPGSGASSPRLIGIYNSHLYFTADDGDNAGGNTDLFIVDATTSTLPVNLASFTASPLKEDVQVKWTTATETNTGLFTVERSANGKQFENVGTVEAAGNSVNERQYTFLDINALHLNTPMLYYRLLTSDKDGSMSYSSIVPVKTDGSMVSVSIYPNPATNFVILNYTATNSSKATIRVTDAAGKLVMAKALTNGGSNQTSIDVKTLPAGVYYVQFITDKGIQSTKFIKQP